MEGLTHLKSWSPVRHVDRAAADHLVPLPDELRGSVGAKCESLDHVGLQGEVVGGKGCWSRKGKVYVHFSLQPYVIKGYSLIEPELPGLPRHA